MTPQGYLTITRDLNALRSETLLHDPLWLANNNPGFKRVTEWRICNKNNKELGSGDNGGRQ